MPPSRRRSSIRERPDEWWNLALVLVLFILINIATDLVSLQNNGVVLNGFMKRLSGDLVEQNFLDRKQYAQQGLDLMAVEEVFETFLTTKETVLEQGFPFQWDPCTLPGIFRSKDEQHQLDSPLQIVFLGGTCTARAASNCGHRDEETHLEDRFTSILADSLEGDSFLHVSDTRQARMDFDVLNMAQGNSGSMLSSLTLDTLVDPKKADILVYEYFVDDSWNVNHASVLNLELWLVRVKTLFQRAGRPVPPIMLLFLWEARIGMQKETKKQYILENGIDSPVYGAWNAIEKYKDQGWNIQAVSVGSTFNNINKIASKPYLIVDDEHHPSCYSVHHISNMIKHAIYTDIASCKAVPKPGRGRQPTVDLKSAWRDDLLSDADKQPETKKLLDFLLRDDVRVSSLSPWEPNAGASRLKFGNRDEIDGYKVKLTETAVRNARADRKWGYDIPLCKHEDNRLFFSLREPELEWFGLGVDCARGPCKNRPNPLSGVLKVEINGVVSDFTEERDHGFQLVTNWLRIPTVMPSRAEAYNVSLCKPDKSVDMTLRQLVGVMLPKFSEREVGVLELLST